MRELILTLPPEAVSLGVSQLSDISAHYSSGNLLARLNAALREDGVDPEHPSIEDSHPTTSSMAAAWATIEVAGIVQAELGDILDIGSGLGGPARYFASRFGCRVTGIDLTPEFCDVARHLTRLLGLEDRVRFELGNAFMPFAEASFDGAYSMNVSMNIADKRAFYGAIHRVLKPGAGYCFRAREGRGRRARLSDGVGRERGYERSSHAGGHAARFARSGIRGTSPAQHPRAGARVRRALARAQ